MALSAYDAMRQQQWAKKLAADYRGLIYTDETQLPTPKSAVFDEAFADRFDGIEFLKIDRTVIAEKNGKRMPYKPWDKSKLIFLPSKDVGALVWGRLARLRTP
ncbi:MAG: hypothetical protein ACLR8Y_02030 [Alistipes indistinctus]